MHRRLTEPEASREFVLFEDLIADSMTDYGVTATAFGSVLASWTVNAPDRLSDCDLAILSALQVNLAVACRRAFTARFRIRWP